VCSRWWGCVIQSLLPNLREQKLCFCNLHQVLGGISKCICKSICNIEGLQGLGSKTFYDQAVRYPTPVHFTERTCPVSLLSLAACFHHPCFFLCYQSTSSLLASPEMLGHVSWKWHHWQKAPVFWMRTLPCCVVVGQLAGLH
jgi:hypothetical protein